jgi:hypothetical protein
MTALSTFSETPAECAARHGVVYVPDALPRIPRANRDAHRMHVTAIGTPPSNPEVDRLLAELVEA